MEQIKIQIVEDEFIIAQDLKLQLENMGYVISHVSDSFQNACAQLKKSSVDIVIIDVKLKGSEDGIQLAEYINENLQIPFIFLSSLTSYRIIERAKKTHPHAYLLKPFSPMETQIAIEIALNNFSNQKLQTELQKPILANESNNLLSIKDNLFLRDGNQFQKIKIEEIYYLEAESNYTTIFTSKGSFIYSQLLKSFESRLPKESFIRVHRSYIINFNQIESFEGNSVFIQKKKIPINSNNRELIFSRLKTF